MPIPGTTKLERLDEYLGAVAVEFSSDDLGAIDAVASPLKLQGGRLPAAMMKMTGL